MKIAISSVDNKIDSIIDPRFGRCRYFIIVDTDSFDYVSVENPGFNTAQGAGIQAAQVVSSLNVNAVITGNVGPNAYQALSAAGIKIYSCIGETVRNSVNLFNAGSLKEISAPTVAAHFGMNTAPGQNQAPGMGMGGGMGRGRGKGRGGGGGRGHGGW